MGGGPAQETLLFVFQTEEPKHIIDNFRKSFPQIEVIYHRLSPPTATDKQVGGIQYSRNAQVPKEVWRKATILVTLATLPEPKLVPNLRYVHLLSAGVDWLINHPIFTKTDIPVTTVSGIAATTIAEWVIMTSLAVNKSLNTMLQRQQKKKWDSSTAQLMKKVDWYDKTVGICGYGSIGRQCARVYQAMGCKIHAFTASPRPTTESRKDEGFILPNCGDPEGSIPEAWYSGHSKEALHTFLASGLDVVVISVPLTNGTRGMFGQEEFDILFKSSMEKAKKQGVADDNTQLPIGEGCILVNLSRGPVVNTDALIAALNGKIQGAALDVTDPEPLPETSRLWELENVVITPHISGLSKDYLGRGFEVLKENLRRRKAGHKLLNEVNRKAGY